MQVKEEDVVELFKQIGVIAKIKQKFGFKDEWPWNVRLYKDGYRNKGDGTVTYEDPMAAHSAGKFFTGHKLKGSEVRRPVLFRSTILLFRFLLSVRLSHLHAW